MPKPNASRYAVLGLLNLEPSSGYDIKQFIESSLGHFWSESDRWIYVTLRQLKADGLASGRAQDQAGRPDRIVYTITPSGRRALRSWLLEPAQPRRPRNELLLKLFLGQAIPADANAQHVERHREAMLDRQVQLGQYERELPQMGLDAQSRRHLSLTLRLAKRVTAAHLRWCDEASALLKKGSRPSKPRRRAPAKRARR